METSNNSIFSLSATRWPLFHKGRSWPITIFRSALIFFIGLFFLSTITGCLYETTPKGMVVVPAGEFTMGSSEEDTANHALSLGLFKPWFADESPEHRPTSRSYFIDKYEVTNLQYYIFCQATDHKPPRIWGGPKYPEGLAQHPVTYINFYDAATYAQWAGKRLPTEIEWEKAARGDRGHTYPWGYSFRAQAANIPQSAKTKGELKPVGSYPEGASVYGAEDMVGNAWEWVWDYYLPYPESKYSNKNYGEKYLLVRGLSYMSVGHFPEKEFEQVVRLKARAAYRQKLHPLVREKDVGFRCVKERRPLFEKWFGEKKTAS
jgi:formylglycine-generating enzyme required for sulfatase activity